jgi:hypothetical protein
MAPQTPKAIYAFIETILSIAGDNEEFITRVHRPMFYEVFVKGESYYVNTVIRSMYVHAENGERTLAEVVGPIMFNPAFILQIIAQTGGDPEMGHGGKGDIWRWSGVQQHTDINGQTRPLISWQ